MPIRVWYNVEVHTKQEQGKKRPRGIYDAGLRMADEQSLSIAGVSSKIWEILDVCRDELRRWEAKVKRYDIVDVERKGDKIIQRGVIVIDYPEENITFSDGRSFTALLAYIAGDLMDSVYLKRIEISRIELPDRIKEFFGGPRRAVWLRKLRGEGPYLALIMKPSLGLTSDKYAKIAYHVAKAGIHMITDDEKLSDPPYSPRIRRINEIIRSIKRAKADSTIYFVNVSSHNILNAVKEIIDKVTDLERLGILIPSTYAGYDVINEVRKEFELPIYTRNSGFSAITEGDRSISHQVLAYLERLAGSDIIQVPPVVGVHKKEFDIVRLAVDAVLGEDSIMSAIPLMGAGINPARAYYATRMGFHDVVFLVGRAIVGHPDGPEAGVKAMLCAFDAGKKGLTIFEAIEECEEFKKAYELRGE